jgi:hypothetical protein
MFPVGILVLALLLVYRPGGKPSRSIILTASIAFTLVVSPQVYAMRILSGHESFGNVGSIAYARYVNRYPKLWVGQPAGSGTPAPFHRTVVRNAACVLVSNEQG